MNVFLLLFVTQLTLRCVRAQHTTNTMRATPNAINRQMATVLTSNCPTTQSPFTSEMQTMMTSNFPTTQSPFTPERQTMMTSNQRLTPVTSMAMYVSVRRLMLTIPVAKLIVRVMVCTTIGVFATQPSRPVDTTANRRHTVATLRGHRFDNLAYQNHVAPKTDKL